MLCTVCRSIWCCAGLVYQAIRFLCIFINDLRKVQRHAEMPLYADDGKFFGNVNTQESRHLIQADLNAVAELSATNKLPISQDKSCVLH